MKRASVSRRNEHLSSPPMRSRSSERSIIVVEDDHSNNNDNQNKINQNKNQNKNQNNDHDDNDNNNNKNINIGQNEEVEVALCLNDVSIKSTRSTSSDGNDHGQQQQQQQQQQQHEHEQEERFSSTKPTSTSSSSHHRRAMSDPFDTQQELASNRSKDDDDDVKEKDMEDDDDDDNVLENNNNKQIMNGAGCRRDDGRPAVLAAAAVAALPTLPRYPVEAMRNMNCWSETPHDKYMVRGTNYFHDKKKIESQSYLFVARGCDVFLCENKAQPEQPYQLNTQTILGGQLRKKSTLAINFRFPWGYMNLYYEIPNKFIPYIHQSAHTNNSNNNNNSTNNNNGNASNHNSNRSSSLSSLTPSERCLARWFSGNDEYKNERLKLIAYVAEGPWVVRNMVTGKPAIIGKKLPVSYQLDHSSSCHPNHNNNNNSHDNNNSKPLLTVTLDIGNSSKTARNIVSVCRRYMSSLTVDIGFVIQAQQHDELPEQMLGSIRIHGVDPLKAPKLS